MPLTTTKRLLGKVTVQADQQTEAKYEMKWKPVARSVVTGLSVNWIQPVSAKDVVAVLFLPYKPSMLPQPPNYRIEYGVNGLSIALLESFFQRPDFISESGYDPITTPIPLGLPDDEFIVRLTGTSVKVSADFGFEVHIDTRPMTT